MLLVRSCAATMAGRTYQLTYFHHPLFPLRVRCGGGSAVNTSRFLRYTWKRNSLLCAAAMARPPRRRSRVVFFLVLLAVCPPFLSGHANPTALTQSRPLCPAREPPTHLPEYTESSLQISHLFFSQKFILHVTLISGFVLLCAVVLLDLLMKTVFWSCSAAVYLITPKSLPLSISW